MFCELIPTRQSARPPKQDGLASADDIINSARDGRIVVLIDHSGPNVTGFLTFPAQMSTPSVIGFMVQHGRGSICLSLTQQRADQLALGSIAGKARLDPDPILAGWKASREDDGAGKLASQLARTVAMAVNGVPEDLVSPGHVFPMIARQGGLLRCGGRAEAAIDLPQLAGLSPFGLTCAIVDDYGAPLGRQDLLRFGQVHGLNVGSIEDLVAHRVRHDRIISRSSEYRFTSKYGGDWRFLTFQHHVDQSEAYVLVKGKLPSARPTPLIIHVLSWLDDVLGRVHADRPTLTQTMASIEAHGAGMIFVIPSESLSGEGLDPDVLALHGPLVIAQILADLDIPEVALIEGPPDLAVELGRSGFMVKTERLSNIWPLPADSDGS